MSARDVLGGAVGTTMCRCARERWTTIRPSWETAEALYGTVMWIGPSRTGTMCHSSAAVRWLRTADAPPYLSAATTRDARGNGPVKVP